MTRWTILACALLGFLASASLARAADTWTTYTNARYGTAIDYPADLFMPLPPPENGDGLRFEGADGRAWFIVFASQNVLEMSAAALAAFDAETGGYDDITYRRIGADWYVLSGYRGGDIFYRRVILAEGGAVQHSFEIGYPAEEKARFDPIVTRMAKSFRAGP